MANHNRSILVIFFVGMHISSCVVNGNFKGLYSYYNETKSANSELFINISDANTLKSIRATDTARIYLIDGIILKKVLETIDKAVIYIWAPNCKGKFCYPLNILQQRSNEKQTDLFIVAEYYDSYRMLMNYKIDRPVYGINTSHYGTNVTSKYLSGFLKDITNQDKIEDRILYFEKGIFKKSFDDIREI